MKRLPLPVVLCRNDRKIFILHNKIGKMGKRRQSKKGICFVVITARMSDSPLVRLVGDNPPPTPDVHPKKEPFLYSKKPRRAARRAPAGAGPNRRAHAAPLACPSTSSSFSPGGNPETGCTL